MRTLPFLSQRQAVVLRKFRGSWCPSYVSPFSTTLRIFLKVQYLVNGGFAEYCTYSASKLFKFRKSSWTEAALFEATACAIHGVDRIRPSVGSTILLLGAGATGLCLAQLLKLNGSALIVLAANAGQKMDLAKNLRVADVYVDLDRNAPGPQWEKLRHDYPYGFDIVVEATGDPTMIETTMDLCARGGMLVLYGVYPAEALVKISPSRVFLDEITVIGYARRPYRNPGGSS